MLVSRGRSIRMGSRFLERRKTASSKNARKKLNGPIAGPRTTFSRIRYRKMKPLFAGILCTTLMAMLCAAPAALAQQKTIKECRAEWQANKTEKKGERINQNA